MRALALVIGFGPFEDVLVNASGELARRLAADPPPGIEVVAALLPVSFRRAPQSFDESLAGLAPRRPALILALGVHKAAGFRLERRAELRVVNPGRPDADGGVTLDGILAPSQTLATSLELDGLARDLAAQAPQPIFVSLDAGGYVCERVYHHALWRAESCSARALFVHVPRVETLALELQLPFVRALLARMAR